MSQRIRHTSMEQFQTELLELILLGKHNQRGIIKQIDSIVMRVGISCIELWRNQTNQKKNTLLHELIENDLFDVIDHILRKYKFDLNIRRESDGLTPLQLAEYHRNKELYNLLKSYEYEQLQASDTMQHRNMKDQARMTNLIWIYLELTSIENPQILECAVVITDKEINELERRNWVIHFEQEELDKLSEWHQNACQSVQQGGNGLFTESTESKYTVQQVEQEFLESLKRHCAEKACSLIGSSSHIDKEVLKRCMPKVYDYLHYRAIDVSSFLTILRYWGPCIENDIKRQIPMDEHDLTKYRAMFDIQWSITFIRIFRSYMRSIPNTLICLPYESHNGNGSLTEYNTSYHKMIKPKSITNERKLTVSKDEQYLIQRLDVNRNFDIKSLHLPCADQLIYNENPHLRQVFMNGQQLKIIDGYFTYKNRLVSLPIDQSYMSRSMSKNINTFEYWKDRKLLLTEIEFLTNYGLSQDYLVVYAGAAPALHINFLSQLFPHLEFVLIDTKDFLIKETDKIHIRREYFTNDMARFYSNSKDNLLFICNMKTYDQNKSVRENISHDMENQMIWHDMMKPNASLLNFRLFQTPGQTKYFDGDLVIEPWAAKRTDQCRLVVGKDSSIIEYNNVVFEESMNYFHNLTRLSYYKHDMDDVYTEGLDHCYDCRAEIFILQRYLERFLQMTDESEIKIRISRLSHDISRSIQDQTVSNIIKTVRTLEIVPKIFNSYE